MEAAFASAAEQLRQSGVGPEEIDDRTVSVFGDFTAEETVQAAARLGIERVRTCGVALSAELRTNVSRAQDRRDSRKSLSLQLRMPGFLLRRDGVTDAVPSADR